MSGHSENLYVVAKDATNIEDEKVYCTALRDLLNAVRDNWYGITFDFYAENKGVIKIVLNGRTARHVNEVKVKMFDYLSNAGETFVESMFAVRPSQVLQTVAQIGAPIPEVPSVVSSVVPATIATVTEDILIVMARHQQPQQAGNLAAQLQCAEALVGAALKQMVDDGLATTTTHAVFSLTVTGVAAAELTAHRGRKAIVEALLAAPDYQLTTADITERMQRDITPPKEQLRMLVGEGVVMPSGKEPRRPGVKGAPRNLYKLTELGMQLGHDYVPPIIRSGWGKCSQVRAQVLEVLLKADGGQLLALDIAGQIGVHVRTVQNVLTLGEKMAYISREVVGLRPRKYGYCLTATGVTSSLEYVQYYRSQALAGVVEVVSRVTERYEVVLTGRAQDVARMVAGIRRLDKNPEVDVKVRPI